MHDAKKILDLANAIKDEVIKDRRHLHENPELAFSEEKTSLYVQNRLNELGIEYETGYAKTGVVGIIRGKKGEGRTVLLRADMDALPMQEQNDIPCRSKVDGCMHACGHDAHTAMLLGVAKVLKSMEDDFCGNVKLMFQPAEEGDGGAEPMIKAGILDNPNVDGAFALHVEPTYECGTVAIKGGAIMASPDGFKITVKGKGGHGAYPHNTIDPILTAAKIIEGLQSINSRNINTTTPSVLSVCQISGGEAYNVIPDTVTLSGTTRAFDMETRKELFDRIEKISSGICAAMGASCECEFEYMFPPLVNDDNMAKLVCDAASEIIGKENVLELKTPFMGGDDFSYIANEVESAYFYLGCRNEEKGIINPWHSSNFNIDEDCLGVGVGVMVNCALTYLER
ncbi:MAG: amidohydrolase [Ruminococcaceae bacterium]|nr:amidohydrolase [Oscillospiraceae bacterium]